MSYPLPHYFGLWGLASLDDRHNLDSDNTWCSGATWFAGTGTDLQRKPITRFCVKPFLLIFTMQSAASRCHAEQAVLPNTSILNRNPLIIRVHYRHGMLANAVSVVMQYNCVPAGQLLSNSNCIRASGCMHCWIKSISVYYYLCESAQLQCELCWMLLVKVSSWFCKC